MKHFYFLFVSFILIFHVACSSYFNDMFSEVSEKMQTATGISYPNEESNTSSTSSTATEQNSQTLPSEDDNIVYTTSNEDPFLNSELYTKGNLTSASSTDIYCFSAIQNNTYSIYIDDKSEGSASYTADIQLCINSVQNESSDYIDSSYNSGNIKTFKAEKSGLYYIFVSPKDKNSNNIGTYAIALSKESGKAETLYKTEKGSIPLTAGTVSLLDLSSFESPVTLILTGAFSNDSVFGYNIYKVIDKIKGSPADITLDMTGVTKWEGNATFENCTKLVSVSLSNDVEITQSMFKGLTNLVSVKLPNSVTEIPIYMFEGCTNLESIDIPASVEVIGGSAFKDCTNLKNITFESSNTLTEIGRCAFENCTSLSNFALPNSLNKIGLSAFKNCTSLTNITIPSNVSELGSAFENCTNITDVIIENGLSKIGEMAFYGCKNLKNITIPNSITEIAIRAFSNCTSLETISLPGSIRNFGIMVFEDCTSLKRITLPNSLKYINTSLFKNCSNLEEVIIPSSVIKIWHYAFSGCSNLTSISLPTDLEEIAYSTFENCSNLSTITIPKNVCEIGYRAFLGCSSLKNVVFVDTSSTWSVNSNISVDVKDSEKNAVNLTETYCSYSYTWKKNE